MGYRIADCGNHLTATENYMPYGITHLPPGSDNFSAFPQQKLVLDLATPEGYKAELTWMVVISQDSLPTIDRWA